MIALSTIWGPDRFESYPALFAGLRETFPSFEMTHPAWPGHSAPPATVFRGAGVKCQGVLLIAGPEAFDPAAAGARARAALGSIASAVAAARVSGGPGVCIDAGAVPRVGGWDGFRKALRGEGGPDADKIIAEGIEYRRESWSAGLESLARNLHAACRAAGGVEIRVQTPPDPSMYPSPEELGLLLAEVRSPALRYCHCPGRAAFLKQRVGWDDGAWLEIAAGRTVMAVAEDGCTAGHGMLPGEGAVDFPRLADQLPGKATVVLRPPGSASEAHVRAAAAMLASARLGLA